MVKFFVGIAIVAFTSFCGHLLAKKYRQRKQFFKQIWEFNERFLSEISYARRPLKEFIKAYTYEGEFEDALNEFYAYLKENPITPSFLEGEKFAFLKKEELQLLGNYFFMLGKGDSASQKGYFSSIKDTLKKLQSEAEIDTKRYGDLYVKIGFLCGLFALILIV